MAMPAVGRFMGTPASIKASDEPQTVAIEDEPFDSVISATIRPPRSKRRDNQRLRLATGEKRRTMGARQDANFRDDRPDRLDIAAIDANAGIENIPADNLGLQIVKDLGDLFLGKLRLGVGWE
jgi:hypothetical protein